MQKWGLCRQNYFHNFENKRNDLCVPFFRMGWKNSVFYLIKRRYILLIKYRLRTSKNHTLFFDDLIQTTDSNDLVKMLRRG